MTLSSCLPVKPADEVRGDPEENSRHESKEQLLAGRAPRLRNKYRRYAVFQHRVDREFARPKAYSHGATLSVTLITDTVPIVSK